MFTGLTRQEQRALILVLIIAVGGMALHQIRNDGRDADLVLDAKTGQVIVDSEETEPELPSTTPQTTPPAATTLVDLNTATLTGLTTLPGIGEVKAHSIINEREQNGAFASVEDLTRVTGIGERTVQNLAHMATVTGVPAPDPASRVSITTLPPPPAPAPVATSPNLVNVNTATLEELKSLPGIGDVMAQRIIAHREAYGAFRQPRDLLIVPRIGEITLQRLTPLITF